MFGAANPHPIASPLKSRHVGFIREHVTEFDACEIGLVTSGVDIAELRMMVRFVEVMDLRLEFLDATAIRCAGQFESAGGGRRRAVDEKEIDNRGGAEAGEDEEGPEKIFATDRFNAHPEAEQLKE